MVLIFAISSIILPSAFATHDEPYNPQNDTDRDGISDKYDQCRSQAETVNGYNDEDGCPDTLPLKDSDSDDISDDYDKCPTQAETVNNYQDTDGCPDTVTDSERLVIEPVTVYKYQSDDVSVILFKTNQKLYVNAVRIWTEDTNVYEFFSGQNYWEGKKESNRSVIFEKNDPCCLGYSKFSIITEDPKPVIYWQVIGENKIISSGSTEHIPNITKSDPFYKDAYDMNYNTARDDSRKKQQYKEQDLTSAKSQQYTEPTKYPANPVFGLEKGQWIKYKVSTDITSNDPVSSAEVAKFAPLLNFRQYLNADSIKMKIDDVSDSQVIMTSSGILNGKEETLAHRSIELREFAFAIPTNIKIGDTIDWMGNELVAKEYVKTTINGKQVDALMAAYQQRQYLDQYSDQYFDFNIENLYHKDSGIMLSTKINMIGKVFGTTNVSIGIEAIEISKNLQNQTFMDSFNNWFSQIADWLKRI